MGNLQERLRALPAETLQGIRRGIEKESLRVRADGKLSTLPHPAAFGSALTHPHITTDFSESQLELITGVHAGVEACLDELTQIHQVVFRHVGDEMLWVSSMPCGLPADDAIPLGRYGTSNVGRAKTVYRTGLSYRYGRRMQTISGVHYNFSLPGVSNDGYFSLIRNFRRRSWLLLYLFGASPAVCSSFVAGRKHDLQPLKGGTLYRPAATSLRMGPLGYQSEAQGSLAVSYNSLQGYGASLQDALTRPYPPYEKIGILGPDGEYRQLAVTLLQIENEFYGTIRPKRVIMQGERPLHALRERGIEYIEVRLMDLDPFCPIGIRAATIRFLDVYLLHCLLSDSPTDTPGEIASLGRNQHRAAARGREPGLLLERGSEQVTLADWGRQVVAECQPIAAALDAVHGGHAYGEALACAAAALNDPALVPSARVLEAMAQKHDNSYVRFALAQSLKHHDTLQSHPPSAEVEQRFTRMAEDSDQEQKRIEAADTMPFEIYRQQYLARERIDRRRDLGV